MWRHPAEYGLTRQERVNPTTILPKHVLDPLSESSRTMMADRPLGLVFWRVLDALDYWLTLTRLRILDALYGERVEITADE
jgi:hypothetical protein